MNQRRGLAQIFDPTRRKSIIAAKRGMAMARIPFSRSVTRIGPCQPLVQTRSLPALMSVPLFVGAMPFTLEIGEALLFHPGFSAKQEIARGALHVDYNGVIGLSVTRGSGGQLSEQDTCKATSESLIQTSTAFHCWLLSAW